MGTLDLQSARIDSNVLLGILFSLTMGLSFLGLGLFSVYGISDNEVRGLLWGSLNFCRWRDFYIIAGAAGVELVVVLLFYKELRAILFSREHASAAGIHTTPVWTILLDSHERRSDRQLPDRRRPDDLRSADQPGRGGVSARAGIWQIAGLLDAVSGRSAGLAAF